MQQLSIVIPVAPNDEQWRRLLEQLLRLADFPQIIIAACRPYSGQTALPANVQWLIAQQGRALQLNVGAQAAEKNTLWFLHADSEVNLSVVNAVRRFLNVDSEQLGYFTLQFADDGPTLTHLNAICANWRSRYLGLPYGDQGFIQKKAMFEQLGGFDESVKVGEDLDYVVRWKASGYELAELPANLKTSARRYQDTGWLLTTLRHVYLTGYLTLQAKLRIIQSKTG